MDTNPVQISSRDSLPHPNDLKSSTVDTNPVQIISRDYCLPHPNDLKSSTVDTNPGQIISRDYCLPQSINLTIIRTVCNTKEDFHIVDSNDNLIFKVTSKFWSFHYRKVLVDAAGNPIINIKRKVFSLKRRWEAFRGERSEPQDLIFSALRSSSYFQVNTKVNVYLANNASEAVCDCKVKSKNKRSCVIYVGESTNIAAQMCRTMRISCVVKEKFMVTVNSNIDYAFIVALIVILDDMNTPFFAAPGSRATW